MHAVLRAVSYTHLDVYKRQHVLFVIQVLKWIKTVKGFFVLFKLAAILTFLPAGWYDRRRFVRFYFVLQNTF